MIQQLKFGNIYGIQNFLLKLIEHVIKKHNVVFVYLPNH